MNWSLQEQRFCTIFSFQISHGKQDLQTWFFCNPSKSFYYSKSISIWLMQFWSLILPCHHSACEENWFCVWITISWIFLSALELMEFGGIRFVTHIVHSLSVARSLANSQMDLIFAIQVNFWATPSFSIWLMQFWSFPHVCIFHVKKTDFVGEPPYHVFSLQHWNQWSFEEEGLWPTSFILFKLWDAVAV